MTPTRRLLLASALGLPVAAGTFVAVRQSASESALRQALHRFDSRYESALKALAAGPNVPDALALTDVRALETALVPLRVVHRLDLVDVIRADGVIVTALRAERFGIRARDMVDRSAGSWPITTSALKAAQPPVTPSPAALVKTTWGDAIYRAIPVNQHGRVVGAILVGIPLEDALKP